MRKLASLLILSTLFAILTGVNLASVRVAQNGPDAEEYEVYSALINERYTASSIQQINIEGMSLAAYNKVPDTLKTLPHISGKTVADFKTKNTEAVAFNDLFHVKVKHELLEKGVVRVIPAHGTTILALSRVGFNAKRDQALVYVIENCGGRCGKNYFALVVKEDGEWKLKGVEIIVVK
ncbi:MAG: hypothetical protein DMF68_14075 [Acidobacteria bacterium]|nr:MAG: hypothetical protein DMF68_14075 [Acidobacteriota bacterium]